MVNNTLLRSAGAQLGELRASLDGLRQGGRAASPAGTPASSPGTNPLGADLIGQVVAALPSLIEYAGLARQMFGSGKGADSPVKAKRNTGPSLGRRLRRYLAAGLVLGGCYLAYRVMRPAPQPGRARA